jgi:hypothetical protein
MFAGIAIFHPIVQITIHFIARNRLLFPDYPFRIFITPKKIDVIGKKINAAPARRAGMPIQMSEFHRFQTLYLYVFP